MCLNYVTWRIAFRFNINRRTGTITVRNCRFPGGRNCIDYEQRHQYQLLVTASDSQGEGYSSTATVIVNVTDANDNEPEFPQDQYATTVPENSTKFSPPLILAVCLYAVRLTHQRTR